VLHHRLSTVVQFRNLRILLVSATAGDGAVGAAAAAAAPKNLRKLVLF
jgi:hypothetical protein